MVQVTGEQIARRVKRQFGDESGVQVTNDDVIMWLNDAVREAAIQNGSINLKRKFVPAISGGNICNLPDSDNLASVHSISYRAHNQGPYVPLAYLSPAQFEQLFPEWNAGRGVNTGTPAFYSADGSGKFRVFPSPSLTDGLGFSVVYNSFFCEVEDLTSALDISPRYYQYLVEYCLMKAYEMDENWEAADRKASFIQSTLNMLGTEDTNLNNTVYPTISSAPEDL